MPSSLFMALTYLLKHVFAMIDMSIFSKFGCRLPPFFSSLAPLFFHSLSSTHIFYARTFIRKKYHHLPRSSDNLSLLLFGDQAAAAATVDLNHRRRTIIVIMN